MSDHLYIHVPFCLRKCRYCDFYSETDLSRIQAYVLGLEREIRLLSEIRGQRGPVTTVYFGGGTPSVLPLDGLETVMAALDQWYLISPDAEITLEANPGTLDLDYLKGLLGLGINRLSLGVQSFDDKRLSLLGRIHTGGQAARAVEAARAAGFENIGMDLIYGLPGDTGAGWQKEMDSALVFAPEHLSCYMLTLEKGTPLYRQYEQGIFTPMGAAAQVDLFTLTSRYLTDRGYDHYEISNFSRGEETRSRHNSAYWNMVPYAGFGPSAHSYWIEPEKNRHIRSWNRSDLNAYLKTLSRGCLPLDEQEVLSGSQQILERIMVGLRTKEGMDIKAVDPIFASSIQRDFQDLIRGLEREGLGRITGHGNSLVLSLAGWARLDNILEDFARRLSL